MGGDSDILGQLPAAIHEDWVQSFVVLQQAMLEHRRAQERILERALRYHCGAEVANSYPDGSQEGGGAHAGAQDQDGPRYTPQPELGPCCAPQPELEPCCAPQPELGPCCTPQPEGAMAALAAIDSSCSVHGFKSFHGFQSLARGSSLMDVLHNDSVRRVSVLQGKRAHHMRPRLWERLEERALGVLIWWNALREPPRTSRLARVMRSSMWEATSALAILINTCVMTWTVDVQMHITSSPSEFPLWVDAVETFFTMFFTFEVVLQLSVHRLYFFCNEMMSWNMFDGFLVSLALLEFAGTSESNVTFMRSLRVLRIVRALRILKYATELRCMLQSVVGSVMSLFWAFAVITFIFFLFSLALVQGMSMQITSVSLDDDAMSLTVSQFGSVGRAMYAFLICTTGGDDWVNYVNSLVPLGPLNVWVFLIGVNLTQIALMNILTGIFVEKAIQLGVPDHDARILQKRRADARIAKELCAFLNTLDSDRSGTISWKEFSAVSQDEVVESMMKVLGVDIRDAQMFFDIVAASDPYGEVEISVLADVLMCLKGQATGFDVQALAYRTHILSKQVDKIQRLILMRSLTAEDACDTDAVDRSQGVPPNIARL